MHATDLEFLTKHIQHADLCGRLRQARPTGEWPGQDRIVITLTDAEQIQMLDQLSGLFVKLGIASDHEPNNTGFYIESLIDRFNVDVFDEAGERPGKSQ